MENKRSFLGKKLEENSNKYRRLKRALFGDPSGKIRTFAIISADNPLGTFEETEWNEIDEKERNAYNRSSRQSIKQLLSKNLQNKTPEQIKAIRAYDGKKALGYGGFDYIQIKGKYGNHEITYMIFNLTQDDAKTIARSFGQESYFYAKVSIDPNKEPSTIAYYKTFNGCNTYKLIDISKTVTLETDAEDFFSKYGLKFRINMREFGDNISPVENAGMFEESFTRNTFMSRGRARKSSRVREDI